MTGLGRSWAYAGAGLGVAVSVAANVAHAYVPPVGAPPVWSPHAGAVVGAVFWPVAVVVALEVLTRIDWPDATRWTVLRWGGLAPVALVAAIVSYRHLSSLLAYYGEDGVTSALGPLAVDGLMVLCSAALLVEPSTRRAARRKPVKASSAEPATPQQAAQPAAAGAGTAPPPKPRKPMTAPVSRDDLVLVGQAVAADLDRAGVPLTRKALVEGLRERGHPVGTDRARALLAALKAA